MNKIFIALTLCLASLNAVAESMTCNRNTSSYDCLVCNCYHESRGEPREGRIAVAKTVLSRKENRDYDYPNSVCAVVYQDNQFSWTQDSYSNNISATKLEDIEGLKDCRDDVDTAINEGANGLLFFYNPRKVGAAWARGKQLCGRIGEHAFYVPRGKTCPKKLGSTGGQSSSSGQQRSGGGGTAR